MVDGYWMRHKPIRCAEWPRTSEVLVRRKRWFSCVKQTNRIVWYEGERPVSLDVLLVCRVPEIPIAISDGRADGEVVRVGNRSEMLLRSL